MSTVDSIAGQVHSDLTNSANQVCTNRSGEIFFFTCNFIGSYVSVLVCLELLLRNYLLITRRMSFVRSLLMGSFFMHCISHTVDEQFLLQRLANASIDIYGMAAVLSRYSRLCLIGISGSDQDFSPQ